MNHLKNNKVYIDEKIFKKEGFKDYLCEVGFEISEEKSDVLLQFADGLNARRNKNSLQIVHPSYKKRNRYSYTPFVGERGIEYLSQVIYNMISEIE